jgi:hypothetical protein
MADCMEFPKTWEQFLHNYEFEDSRRIYTNGSRLIPSFRVKDMMEHYLLEAKSEAYREFAEKLKKEVVNIPAWGRVAEKKIDNLVKELTESKNDLEG